MVAIDHHTAVRVCHQLVDHLGKGPEGKPFVALNLADREFVVFPAIDQLWSLLSRKTDPLGNSTRADFQRSLGVRQ